MHYIKEVTLFFRLAARGPSLLSKSHLFQHQMSPKGLEMYAVRRKSTMIYAGMILHHIINQNMPMSKSERQPFAQEPPWVPQVSPKGPKF